MSPPERGPVIGTSTQAPSEQQRTLSPEPKTPSEQLFALQQERIQTQETFKNTMTIQNADALIRILEKEIEQSKSERMGDIEIAALQKEGRRVVHERNALVLINLRGNVDNFAG